jgi:TP901 family phage tail tape measure protein
MIGLGSRTQLGIGIGVYLEDRFSKRAQQLNETLKNLHKNSFGHVDRAAREYRNSSATIAAAAGIATVAMVQAAIKGSEFEHSMRQIKIIAGSELPDSLDSITSKAEKMANQFGKMPSDVAYAMLENVRAGITQDLDYVTQKQIQLAVSANEALEGQEGVAFGILSIMGQYNLKATQMVDVAGMQVKAIDAIANGLQVAANKSMASVNDINVAMQYFGDTAMRTNMSLEESLALVAQMSQGGIRGSSAGVAAANLVQHLINNTGELAGPKKQWALAQTGISQEHVRNMVNQGRIYDLLQDFAAGIAKLDEYTQGTVTHQLFGVRGNRGLATAFQALLKGSAQGRNELGVNTLKDQIVAGIKNDTLTKQVGAMMNDAFTDINKFTAQLDILRNQFVRAAGPVIRWVTQFGTAVLRVAGTILETPIGKILAGIAVVAAPLIAIMFAFRAAVVTASFALRGFAMQAATNAAVGRYGGSWMGTLTGGVLGGPTGAGAHGGLKKNKSGAWYVPAGQTWTNPQTGQLYKAGKIVPQSAAQGAMGVGQLAGKATGLLGTIARGAGRLFPIAMAVMGIWELFKMIAGDPDEGKGRPELMAYQQALFRASLSSPDFKKALDSNNKQLNQNLVVNIDGVKATEKRITGLLSDNMNTQFDHQLPDY